MARAVGDHVAPEKGDRNSGADLEASAYTALSKRGSEQIPGGAGGGAQWTVSGQCLRDLTERGRGSPLCR